MKKFLLTAALVLALVTSLTAGTMAYYTATVNTTDQSIRTERFSFTLDELAGSFLKTVTLAPGEAAYYAINVNNASEVRTDAAVVATLEGKSIPGMTIDVEYVEGSTENEGIEETNDTAYKAGATTLMAIGSDAKYQITVHWEPQAENDAAHQNETLTMKINVSGIQHHADNKDWGADLTAG